MAQERARDGDALSLANREADAAFTNDFAHTAWKSVDEFAGSCELGCPCCVGKPLRQTNTINVELAEGNIPSKAAAIAVLQGILRDATVQPQPDEEHLSADPAVLKLRLERALRRRLDRGAEPRLLHPITPEPEITTDTPQSHPEEALEQADTSRRASTRRSFEQRIRKRLASKQGLDGQPPRIGKPPAPRVMRTGPGALTPRHVNPTPQSPEAPQPETPATGEADTPATRRMGDSLAARARRLARAKRHPSN